MRHGILLSRALALNSLQLSPTHLSEEERKLSNLGLRSQKHFFSHFFPFFFENYYNRRQTTQLFVQSSALGFESSALGFQFVGKRKKNIIALHRSESTEWTTMFVVCCVMFVVCCVIY
jgi:hypothetical protein